MKETWEDLVLGAWCNVVGEAENKQERKCRDVLMKRQSKLSTRNTDNKKQKHLQNSNMTFNN